MLEVSFISTNNVCNEFDASFKLSLVFSPVIVFLVSAYLKYASKDGGPSRMTKYERMPSVHMYVLDVSCMA